MRRAYSITSRLPREDYTMINDRQLAERLGVCRASIWRLLSAGRLPEPIRLGRNVRWRENEITDWINADCPPRDKWEWEGSAKVGGAA